MSLIENIALVLVLVSVCAFINHKFIKLPHTIGLVLITLSASLLVVLSTFIFDTGPHLSEIPTKTVKELNLPDFLLNGILAALLFAGALGVDIKNLKSQIAPIASFAIFGVIISAFVIGGLIWLGLNMAGLPMPFMYCLLFGAIISPTDPIAVLGLLKMVKVPPSLEAKIAGESLFNDGAAIVLFSILLTMIASPHEAITATEIYKHFISEALGGATIGLVFGLVAFLMLRAIDDHSIELMITVALAVSTYVMAQHLHTSGAIAVVIAGLVIGQAKHQAMSTSSQTHVAIFWEGLDEILNSILFLIIGLEVFLISYNTNTLILGSMAIVFALMGRFVSVAIPVVLLQHFHVFSRGTIPILTWCGLRGGISVALALSLPESEYKSMILAATYAVVVWTIIVQGLTTPRVIKFYYGNNEVK